MENSKLIHNSSVSAASVNFSVIILTPLCIFQNKSECLKIRVYSTKKLWKIKCQIGNIQLSLSFNFLVINLSLFLFYQFLSEGWGIGWKLSSCHRLYTVLEVHPKVFWALLCFLKFYFIGKILLFIGPLTFHFICKMIFISEYKPVHSATLLFQTVGIVTWLIKCESC